MARSSLGPRQSMVTVLLRNTRKQSKIFIPLLVIKVAAGDLLKQLGVIHNIERVAMVIAAPLLMMMTLRITELSIRRERAPIKSQMMTIGVPQHIS